MRDRNHFVCCVASVVCVLTVFAYRTVWADTSDGSEL